MTNNDFTFGISTLDKLLKPVLEPPSTIVVAGHPGSGKTTLASTICYANALNSKKCLFISQQEDKQKLYRNMKRLGMDFYTLETKGLVKYLSFPISSAVEEIINEMSSVIASQDFRVVVVDSINPLLNAVEHSHAKRAWLQNYFYNLPKTINGVCVLVAELPFGSKTIDLGSIEFVADAVLILKHEIESNLLARKLEIRKSRSSPISIAEIPFSIVENKGIELYAPPILEEIAREGSEIDVCCTKLKDIIKHLHKGMTVYISYPPDARPLIYIPMFIGIAVLNDLKIHILSYLYPPDVIKDLIRKSLSQTGISREIVDKIIQDYIKIRSINPFTYSVDELAIRELLMVPDDVDIVVFHGIEIFATRSKEEYIKSLYNELNYLKNMGKLIIRIGSIVNKEVYDINSMLSDVVIRHDVEQIDGEYRYKMYIWRRGEEPHIIKQEELNSCLEELVHLIKRKLVRD